MNGLGALDDESSARAACHLIPTVPLLPSTYYLHTVRSRMDTAHPLNKLINITIRSLSNNILNTHFPLVSSLWRTSETRPTKPSRPLGDNDPGVVDEAIAAPGMRSTCDPTSTHSIEVTKENVI